MEEQPGEESIQPGRAKSVLRWLRSLRAAEEIRLPVPGGGFLSVSGTVWQRRWLAGVLRRAQSSPTAREALAWAAAKGVRVHVKPSDGEREGAYVIGCGLVILWRSSGDAAAVGALVHEIRHAWQDWHALTPPRQEMGDVAVFSTLTALREADAFAWGDTAQAECAGQVFADAAAQRRRHVLRWMESDLCKTYAGLSVLKFAERDVVSASPGLPYGAIRWDGYIERLSRGFFGAGSYLPPACPDVQDSLLRGHVMRARRPDFSGLSSALQDIFTTLVKQGLRQRRSLRPLAFPDRKCP